MNATTPALEQDPREQLAELRAEVEQHARAILAALQAGDGGEATYQAGRLLDLATGRRVRP
jgi:hypothetical protein